MNRIDFMSRLALLLSDIPDSEREEAIQYYNDYLNDAGVENEEEVLEALGNPENLAVSIKEGLKDNVLGEGEFSESGFHREKEKRSNAMAPFKTAGQEENSFTGTADTKTAGQGGPKDAGNASAGAGAKDSRFSAGGAGPRQTYSNSGPDDLNRRYRNERGRKKGMSGGMIAFLIILAILSMPVTLPVGFAALIVVLVLAAVAVLLICIFLFVGVICIIAGVISFFSSFVDLFTFPAGATLAIGMSLFTIGLGILLTMALVWVVSKIFPKAFRKTADFFSKLVHRKGGNER